MRATWRSLLVALVVGLAGAGVLAAPAGATDANLKTLVHDQQHAESQLEKAVDAATNRIGKPRSLATLRRRFRHLVESFASLAERGRSTDGRFAQQFTAEAAETPQADQGRVLIIQGLQETQTGYRQISQRLRRLTVTVQTERQYKGFLKRLDRATTSATLNRGGRRITQARKLIREAPAPPVR